MSEATVETRTPTDVINELGLTMKTVFIPWSKSRNAKEKDPSLNWLVTISRNGVDILTTDYMAGCAHCPSYKQGDRSLMREACLKFECENGYPARWSDGFDTATRRSGSKPLQPKIEDVLYSLVMDSDVLNYTSFEDWADNFGYDPDSRADEKIYQACLKIALSLRNSVGESSMAKLQEAFQDY